MGHGKERHHQVRFEIQKKLYIVHRSILRSCLLFSDRSVIAFGTLPSPRHPEGTELNDGWRYACVVCVCGVGGVNVGGDGGRGPI